MCLFFSILFLGPRFGLLVYWIGWPARWELAFDGWAVPLLGFFLAPWTTLTWVLCAPAGINGLDVFFVGLAVIVDVATLVGNAGSYRQRSAAGAPSY
ncbi:MAG: hypothetical protein ABWZ52_12255 [Acidimicrobiales bacterium]